jgi:hypothetical protein
MSFICCCMKGLALEMLFAPWSGAAGGRRVAGCSGNLLGVSLSCCCCSGSGGRRGDRRRLPSKLLLPMVAVLLLVLRLVAVRARAANAVLS